MHPRLALVVEEVSFHRGSHELDLAPTSLVDESSLKLVHENFLTLVYYT
jgi:hypothetical protein